MNCYPIARRNIMVQSNWKAQWIWQEEDGPSNTWMCFRKTFSVEALPVSPVIARIAADTKYWMWINGSLAVFEGGLKRGPNPSDTYYDELNIAPWLQEGQNCIAVLVWHWGKDGFAHKNSGKGGFIFDCGWNGMRLDSGSTWKTQVHPAYIREMDDPQPNYRLAEWNIRFDAGLDTLKYWTIAAYDDTAWPQAMEKGVPPAAPWNALHLRPIPQWKDSGLVDYVNHGACRRQENGVVCAKLPYNAQITPYLRVVAPAGKVIRIETDNYAGGGNHEHFNIRGEYVTCEGIQEYENLGWMNGHEVLYSIPEGVEVLELKYRETGYDTAFTGAFACNDSFYNQLWEKARRTLYITMRDNYMDCPDRERAQWWGDAVIEIGEAFYALDRKSHALAKKAIRELAAWQKPDNVMYSPMPEGNWYGVELPVQTLASIGMSGFWTYYMYTGDVETLRVVYPAVKKYLEIWEFDEDGLIQHRQGGWDWADWGENFDTRVLDNAWYYMAVKAAARMSELLEYSEDASMYTSWMQRIEANFNRVLWNGDAYRSPGYEGDTDDRANGLAVVAGLAEDSQWPAILEVLQQHENASPYMEKYVLEALYLMGAESYALERMRKRYAEMVEDSYCTTLWELWKQGGWGTYNHAWAGGPLTLLSQYTAGIAPTVPGFVRFHVQPQLGALQSVMVTVPTVKGDIRAAINSTAGQFRMEIQSPAGTEAEVGIPWLDGHEPERIFINHTLVWAQDGRVSAQSGTFSGVDDRYVKFSLPAGIWNIEAKY